MRKGFGNAGVDKNKSCLSNTNRVILSVESFFTEPGIIRAEYWWYRVDRCMLRLGLRGFNPQDPVLPAPDGVIVPRDIWYTMSGAGWIARARLMGRNNTADVRGFVPVLYSIVTPAPPFFWALRLHKTNCHAVIRIRLFRTIQWKWTDNLYGKSTGNTCSHLLSAFLFGQNVTRWTK